MAGALDQIPGFLVYPISVLSGNGPLWFAQTLFLFCCLLVLIRRLDREDRLWTRCGRANAAVLLLLAFVIWGASQVLNMPVVTVYRFGIYFAAFAIGYFLLSHEAVRKTVVRLRVPTLCLALAGAAAYAARLGGSNYTDSACLQSLLTNLYLWAAVLALFGWAEKCFNIKNLVTDYLTRNSFGIYVLHYPVLMVVCLGLQAQTGLPVLAKYLLALLGGLAGTLLLNELIRRIPGVRFAVLGQRGK